MRNIFAIIIGVAASISAVLVSIMSFVFNLSHPEQTQMQVFIKFFPCWIVVIVLGGLWLLIKPEK